MRGSGITDLIHAFHDRVQGRIITDRRIRAIQVIINRTRQSYDREIKLLSENTRSRQRSVTTDSDQGIDPMLLQLIIGLFSSLGSLELHATGGLKDCSAALNYITDILCLKLFNLIQDQPFVTTVNTFHSHSVINSGTCYRTNSGIHSRGITSGR